MEVEVVVGFSSPAILVVALRFIIFLHPITCNFLPGGPIVHSSFPGQCADVAGFHVSFPDLLET